MARGLILGKDNLTRQILLEVGICGLVMVAGGSPYFLRRASKQIFKDVGRVIDRRVERFKELRKKRLIEFKELGDGNVKVILTEKGKTVVEMYNLEKIKLKRPIKWDKKWRVIIYDIPTSQKDASDAFRRKLFSMGLLQIQRSVWISPFDCLNELMFLAETFRIDFKNIRSFLAINVPDEKEAMKHFDLR